MKLTLRRIIILLSVFFVLVSTISFIVYTNWEAIRVGIMNRAILELEAITGENVSIQKVSLSISNWSLDINDVLIESHKDSKPLFSVKKISLSLCAIPTLSGLKLCFLDIDEPRATVRLNDSKLLDFPGIQKILDKPDTQDKDGKFKLSIGDINIKGGGLLFSDEYKKIFSELNLDHIIGKLTNTSIDYLDIKTKSIDITHPLFEDKIEYLSIKAKQVNEIELDNIFNIKLTSIEAVMSGLQLEGNADIVLEKESKKPKINSELQLSSNLNTIKKHIPQLSLLEGSSVVSASISYNESLNIKANVGFENLVINEFNVEDGNIILKATESNIDIESFKLTRKNGGIINGSAKIDLEAKNLPISSNIELYDIQLAELLEDLSLKDPWVNMTVSGTAQLKGFVKDKLNLYGNVDLDMQDFYVWSNSFHKGHALNQILYVPSAKLASEVEINDKKVNISNAILKNEKSSSEINGNISFDQSMDLSFSFSKIDIGALSPVASLNMKGNGWLNGRIYGSFMDLCIVSDAHIENAQFDDYFTGKIDGPVIVPIKTNKYIRDYKKLEKVLFSQQFPLTEQYVAKQNISPLLDGVVDMIGKYYNKPINEFSEPILFMPFVSSEIGKSFLHGFGAISFFTPLSVFANISTRVSNRSANSATKNVETSNNKLEASYLSDILKIPQVRLENNPIDANLYGNVVVAGSPSTLDGIGHFSFEDAVFYEQVVNEGSINARLVSGDVFVDKLEARTSDGSTSWSVSLTKDLKLLATGSVDKLSLKDINTIKNKPISGYLSSNIEVSGELFSPVISGSAKLTDIFYKDKKLGSSDLNLSSNNDILTIKGQVFDSKGYIETKIPLIKTLPYDIVLDLNKVTFSPYENVSSDNISMLFAIEGSTHLSGALLDDGVPFSISAIIRQFECQLKNKLISNEEHIIISSKDDRLIISPSKLVSDGSNIDLYGEIDFDTNLNIVVSGDISADLIENFTPPGIFQRLEGDLSLSGASDTHGNNEGFRIFGTTDALQFEGVANINDASIRTAFFPALMEQVDSRIVFSSGNQVEIQDMKGMIGSGKFSASGTLLLDTDYFPKHYDLEMKAEEAFIHYPSFLPPGMMDASLRFEGDVGTLLLSGDVYLKNMVYRERYNWEKILTDFRTYYLEQVQNPITEDPYFNIDISVHSPGTFFIRNNIGNVQLKGELNVSGDTNNVNLYGEIESIRGNINILDNKFELNSAKFEFSGDYFNPSMELKMSTQIQTYTITYRVSGTLQDWALIPGSDSGLSERDINALIAFGTLADNITQGEARSVAVPAMEFLIGRLGIFNQLQTFTKLDRLSIVPATDQYGNIGAHVEAEKDIIMNKLSARGFYDYVANGYQNYLFDLEWRPFSCCSLSTRLANSPLVGITTLSPGIRLKLKWENE